MRGVVWCLLMLALAAPAYAGHGTIEETDDGFIVEYSGDASDKANDNKSAGHAAATAVRPTQVAEVPTPAPSMPAPPTPAYQTNNQDGDSANPTKERRRSRRGRYRGSAGTAVNGGSENAE